MKEVQSTGLVTDWMLAWGCENGGEEKGASNMTFRFYLGAQEGKLN